MDKDKLTVLLVSKDDSAVKSFELHSKYIINFKKYLLRAGLLITVIAVFILSLFAYTVKLNNANKLLTSSIGDMSKRMEMADSIKLIEKLNKIDNNLEVIDKYLTSRGILVQQSVGGESVKRQQSSTELLFSLEEQSVVFSNLLRNIPVGYPYYGELSSNYGYRRNPFGGYSGEFHPGIDLKGQYGDPIFATADGTVYRCDWYGGYGNSVVINHSYGYQTLYGHMSKVNVEQGQEIKAGDLIGFMGSTGRSTGTHLHYEIRKDGIDIDPVPYLRPN